ncbi:MAG: trypsin-like peptidase domain-containing protein [Hyphomicrobiales bacterium]|nr:trypsin-like peptidase domain-containing protein [Hyphomicrobiales bacterium]
MTASTRLPSTAALLLLATMTVAPAQTQGEPAQMQRTPAEPQQTTIPPLTPPSSVIYGQDERKDYNDRLVTTGQLRAADATSLVVFGMNGQFAKYVGRQTTFNMPARSRFCSPQAMAQLRTEGMLPANYPDEPFFDDKVLVSRGSCTAFKVGPDLVATAGHCAGANAATACENLSFVFKFHKTDSRPSPDIGISGRDVYQCRQIVERQQVGQLDWAIVRVDRAIDAPQVSIRTSEMPAPTIKADGLTLIGHPAGLPLKIASGGNFLSFQENTFRAIIDAYGGNSGSPIFNTQALERGELLVEGILQGGSDDYVDWCNNPSRTGITPTPQNPCSCAVSYRCSYSADAAKACRGETGVYARHLERALGVGGGGTGGVVGGSGPGGVIFRPTRKEPASSPPQR